MRYEISRTFPARRLDGFAFMMDPQTWPEWNPITIPNAEEVAFADKGDVAAYEYRPLGIPLHGQVHLDKIKAGEEVEMRFEQAAFGEVTMRWDFENAGAHAFTLTVTIDVLEPNWWEKTLHRMSLVPPAIRRDVRHAFDALHAHFMAAHEATAKAS